MMRVTTLNHNPNGISIGSAYLQGSRSRRPLKAQRNFNFSGLAIAGSIPAGRSAVTQRP